MSALISSSASSSFTPRPLIFSASFHPVFSCGQPIFPTRLSNSPSLFSTFYSFFLPHLHLHFPSCLHLLAADLHLSPIRAQSSPVRHNSTAHQWETCDSGTFCRSDDGKAARSHSLVDSEELLDGALLPQLGERVRLKSASVQISICRNMNEFREFLSISRPDEAENWGSTLRPLNGEKSKAFDHLSSNYPLIRLLLQLSLFSNVQICVSHIKKC